MLSEYNTWSDLLEKDIKRAHSVLAFFFLNAKCHSDLLAERRSHFAFSFIAADAKQKKVIEKRKLIAIILCEEIQKTVESAKKKNNTNTRTDKFFIECDINPQHYKETDTMLSYVDVHFFLACFFFFNVKLCQGVEKSGGSLFLSKQHWALIALLSPLCNFIPVTLCEVLSVSLGFHL